MFKKYIVIVDFDSFDKYSVLTKKEYKKNSMKNDILYQGNAEQCNQWIEDNPHPESHDYGVYFGDHSDDDNETMFI